jgi:hypothetical protein
MFVRLSQWSALALTSLLALVACSANGVPTIPGASGLGEPASVASQSAWAVRAANPNVQANAACPERFDACYTVSKAHGLILWWCYGPKNDPCSKSNVTRWHHKAIKWSSVFCKAKGATCPKPIAQMTAKWTGPFKCKGSGYSCKGTYEFDTITPGSGLHKTSKYIYKQDVRICVGSSCQYSLIGLNVGS